MLQVDTDASGLARVSWKLGTTAGDQVLEVKADYAGSGILNSPMNVTATAQPGPADRMESFSGDNQEGAAGQPLSEPFCVRIFDAYDNAVQGFNVDFVVSAGGGSFDGNSTKTVLTDNDGKACATLTLGPDMGELLNGIDGACSVRDFRDQIVAALSTSQAGSLFQIQAQLPEPLTNRELEVLALLAQRRSNKEIAAALVISPTTVKRHASNIYQKLQVNGRRQAATKAISLGLILS
jgi:DNA-binding CsgD family transcriptional regulator